MMLRVRASPPDYELLKRGNILWLEDPDDRWCETCPVDLVGGDGGGKVIDTVFPGGEHTQPPSIRVAKMSLRLTSNVYAAN